MQARVGRVAIGLSMPVLSGEEGLRSWNLDLICTRLVHLISLSVGTLPLRILVLLYFLRKATLLEGGLHYTVRS